MSAIIMQHSPSPPSPCLPQYKCQHPLPNTPSISFGNDTKLTVKNTTATELLFWLRTCLRKEGLVALRIVSPKENSQDENSLP
jgi:hypothetical protein